MQQSILLSFNVISQHVRRKLNGLVLRIMNTRLSHKALPKPKKCQPVLSMQDLPSLSSQCVKYSIKAAHIDVNVNVVAFTVKNYLHGLHGFVANSQKFVVCNRPRENPKRSKFPWSKLQTVCTKLYSYIVLYYAKFGVKSGKS